MVEGSDVSQVRDEDLLSLLSFCLTTIVSVPQVYIALEITNFFFICIVSILLSKESVIGRANH
jgi:hypothetical protein